MRWRGQGGGAWESAREGAAGAWEGARAGAPRGVGGCVGEPQRHAPAAAQHHPLGDAEVRAQRLNVVHQGLRGVACGGSGVQRQGGRGSSRGGSGGSGSGVQHCQLLDALVVHAGMGLWGRCGAALRGHHIAVRAPTRQPRGSDEPQPRWSSRTTRHLVKSKKRLRGACDEAAQRACSRAFGARACVHAPPAMAPPGLTHYLWFGQLAAPGPPCSTMAAGACGADSPCCV